MARELKDGLNPPAPTPTEEVRLPRPTIQLQLSEEMEKALVDTVLEDWDSSKLARLEHHYGTSSKGSKIAFDDWIKSLHDLYSGERIAKEIPWKFCSNRSLRIASAILDMLHARLFPMVVNEDLVRWRPGDLTDVPKVDRINKLMNWWIWIRSSLKNFFDIWVKQTIAYGDSLTESSWKINYIDRGFTEETPIVGEDGNPLTNPDGTPAISRSRRIDRIESTTSHIYPKEKVWLQKGSMDIHKEPVIVEEDFFYRELEQGEAEGQFVNVTNLLKDRMKYEIGVAENLPPEEVEKLSSLKLRNKPVKLLRWFGNFDADGDGFAEDVRIIVNPEHKLFLGGMSLFNITKSGRRPLNLTKFDNRIDRPFDSEGEGILEKVKELAEEIDAIFNQMTDANTLSVMRPGFYDPAGDVDAPVITLAPNKMTPVSDPARNVYFPDFQIPTERLMLAIRMVLEFIERLTAASSYIMGKESEIVGGSGTATRTQAIVQSAEIRFTAPAQRLRDGAARLLRDHLDLLQLNIPQGLETRILGEDMKPVFSEGELSIEGISGECDAFILPDPAMGSKETERELSSMLYSVLLQNIIVGTDPVKIYKITADLLIAHGKKPEEYLGPEPIQDVIDQPEDENTLIIQGDFEQVKAEIVENHLQHIKVHTDLLMSPTLAALPPHLLAEVQQFTQQHIQQHQQMLQVMTSLVGKFGGGADGSIGNEGREGKGAPGASEPPGVENLPGPLGRALDTKRKGESGGSPQLGY